MIVIVGSRHDPIARSLAAELPRGALCGAEDLLRPGWCWPLASPDEDARWVVDGKAVADAQVQGVWVRRSRVHAEELHGTHPDDRDYQASELTAMLGFVLLRTEARVVVNRPVDGVFGEDAVRPERWRAAAHALGMPLAPLRLRSDDNSETPAPARSVEIAAGQPIGRAPRGAAALAAALGLEYLTLIFDGQDRLLALSTMAEPSRRARQALAAKMAAPP